MDAEKGLYGKYRITKADGSPVSGFKFVLSPDNDPAAVEALRAYAFKTKNEQLAEDLFSWLEVLEGGD
jgi:hypothetical protein